MFHHKPTRNIALSTLIPLLISPCVIADENTSVIDVAYTSDIWRNQKGGIKKGTRYLDNIDLQISLPSKSLGWDNGQFFAYGLMNNKATLSDELVGDLQTVSNIDNEHLIRLEEAWYMHQSEDQSASIKFGIYDLNSEFDVVEGADLFINSSHGIGPDFSQSGLNGPSIFPNTSLAIRGDLQFADNWLIRAAILDAEPNNPDKPKSHEYKLNKGALISAEIETRWQNDGRFALGLWTYSKKFELINQLNATETMGKSQGVYGILQSAINAQLSTWLRVGFASSKTNQFGQYWGTGLILSAPFVGREDDTAGFSIGHVRNGDPYLELPHLVPQKRAETNFELTYHFQINDWLAVQPDLQYIINPSSDSLAKDAFLIGIRFEVGFSFNPSF